MRPEWGLSVSPSFSPATELPQWRDWSSRVSPPARLVFPGIILLWLVLVQRRLEVSSTDHVWEDPRTLPHAASRDRSGPEVTAMGRDQERSENLPEMWGRSTA
ncbi:hypothetical protein TIFTF001_027223 [Ficus carica]|uniref:Uncharacterized protein n=1 Tax=Ficus carica TaxID=3494 RepID=A0AA88IY49_FICCA|nr:hypothetical protein TIFTF001_027223 [Ficus carica]